MTNVINGTNENDNLIGTRGVDVFVGSNGSDNIDGGESGYNQIDYAGDPADYTFIRNNDGSVSVRKPGGGVDTISNIGGFWFAGAAVWKPLEDLLSPVDGGVINGTDGDDYIPGTAGDDVINGGEGQDVFVGSTGNDTIDGGSSGYNQIDYAGSSADYTFTKNDDGTVSVVKPDGGVDTISNIGGFWFSGSAEWKPLDELLSNGNGLDSGVGSGGTITGTDGDDFLQGTSGDDIIDGGTGKDVINGSAGNDIIKGGDSGYNQIDYDGAPSDYTFTANADGTVTVVKPGGGVDTISDIGGFWFKGSGEWCSLDHVLTTSTNTVDAVNDTATTQANQSVVIDVVENDIDPEGDAFSVTSFENGSNGSVALNAEGELVYTPNDGFSGDDWFSYTVTDENGAEDSATVEVSVEELDPKNDEVDLELTKTYQNVSKNGREGFANGAYSTDVVKFTLTVTNNSDTVATGVVVKDTTAENLDVWKEGDSLTVADSGLAWNNIVWSSGWGGSFNGSPETVDSTNGWVSVVEAGVSQKNVQVGAGATHGLSEGSVTWELGTPIQPGETVTLEYFGKVNTVGAYNFSSGTEFTNEAWIDSVDQTDINLSNNDDAATSRWISPITLDLNGDGEIGVTGATSSIEKDIDVEIGRTVEFDLDADGTIDTIEWIDGSGDGLLVDLTKIADDGAIDGEALFGDQGGKFTNGYEKLKAHDVDGSGHIEGEELNDLGLWIDDGDAVLEEGELISAAEYGVDSISTSMEIVLDEDGKGLMQSSATLNDGSVVLSEDVWFVEAEDDFMNLTTEPEPECINCEAEYM